MNPNNNRDTFRGRGFRIEELEEQVEQLKQKLLESEQAKGVLCDKCGKMNKINPFYVLVDEDGDVEEMFPESISLDWIIQIRDVRGRANNQKYKVYLLNNFELKEVVL